MNRIDAFYERLEGSLEEITTAGLYKEEKTLAGPQGTKVTADGRRQLNLCSNDYLGLANHLRIVDAARESLTKDGFGLASVRFISGTQQGHLHLERAISALVGQQDAVLFGSCYAANGAVFNALLGEDDVIISDALNHASIIDGIRLSKAQRRVYSNRNLDELEAHLSAAQDARTILIVTDGVFSMDGFLAPLPEICDLAEKCGALVMVDDSHATGVLGENGGGTPELLGVSEKIDIVTGTFGKALGGASGGFVASSARVAKYLRQTARTYLFSNSLVPAVVAGSIEAIDLATNSPELRESLFRNTERFRAGMEAAGFTLLPGNHPIVAVMFQAEPEAVRVAAELYDRGVFVTPFSYPVVPLGEPRIRVQMSASLTDADVDFAVRAFVEAGA